MKFTLAVSNCWGFYWGEHCFYSNHLGKRWLFPSKTHIQFKIFITYFSTKLLFTNKRYHLHLVEKCLYILKEIRSIIYFWQFIHPLSLRSRGNEASNSCSNVLISMTLFRKKKENAKAWTYALANICIIFIILSLYNVTQYLLFLKK